MPEQERSLSDDSGLPADSAIIAMALNLKSPVFEHQGTIPSHYTCDGADVNPELLIDGVPEGTKSLVLLVDDPDAPGGNWDHWTLWNISPDTRSIPENSVPQGSTEGMTDFGRTGWGGPCPPSGQHRYQFKLSALDMRLSLDSSARKADVESAMEGHVLDEIVLVGLYSRQGN